MLLLFSGLAPGLTLAATTVVVVRHAEKALEPGNRDPALSEAGLERARELARVLGETPIAAVYSSDYRRTRQTAAPAARRAGVEVLLRDPRDPDALRDEILRDHRGGVVLVVGHSNTVPGLLASLGVEDPPALGDDQYSDCFIVVVPDCPDDQGENGDRRAASTLVHLRYGDRSGDRSEEKEDQGSP